MKPTEIESRELRWKAPKRSVIAVFWLLSAFLGVLVVFVYGPPLSALARGPLMDTLPFGYEIEQVRGVLFHLEESGRHSFVFPYLFLDIFLALSFSISLCISSLWCQSHIPPLKGRIGTILPALAIVMPILAGCFDLLENWHLYRIMEVGMNVTETMVADSSRATSFKFGFYVVSIFALMVSIFLVFRAAKKNPAA